MPLALGGKRPVSTYALQVALVTVLGLLLRAVELGRVALWSDEAFMGVLVRRPFLAMIDVVHNDNHPPLQYVLDRLAVTVHDSPTALRAPSVVAGVAAIPLAAALGRRVGGDRAGVASGALVAVMPLLVLWSRDARMYALATTMVLATTLALWRAAERPSALRLAVYALAVVIAVYTHYLDALAVPLELAAMAAFLRPPRAVILRLAAVGAIAGLTLLPWVVYAAPQFRHAGEPYWAVPISVGGIAGFVAGLPSHPGPTTLLVLVTVAVVAVVGALALGAYRAGGPRERTGMLYLLGAGGGALAVLFLVSLRKPFFDERFTNLFTTPLLPLGGAALAWTRRAWVMFAVVVALLPVTAVELVTLPTPNVPDAIAPLAGRVDPSRDVVAVNGPWRYFQVLYYGDAGTAAATRVVAAEVPWYDGLAGFRAGDIIPSVPPAPGRVYLVTDPGQERPPMPPGMRLTATHCAQGSCVETWAR